MEPAQQFEHVPYALSFTVTREHLEAEAARAREAAKHPLRRFVERIARRLKAIW